MPLLLALLFFLLPSMALAGPSAASGARGVPAGAGAPMGEGPARIGDAAPPLGLRDLGGRPVELPPGKVVVVDFFATWCGPCHQALAALDRLVRRSGGEVQLIVVAVGEPLETVSAFFARHPPPPGARVLHDPGGEAARRFGQSRFPTTFLMGRDGRVRHINRGYGPGYEARLGRWLDGLLSG